MKITANGTAVKNVYYARETYTIKFMRRDKRKWKEDESLRITARYGVDVSAQWEKPVQIKLAGDQIQIYMIIHSIHF